MCLIYPNGAYRPITDTDELTAAQARLRQLEVTRDQTPAGARLTTILNNIVQAKILVRRRYAEMLNAYGLTGEIGKVPRVVDHWHISQYGRYEWPR